MNKQKENKKEETKHCDIHSVIPRFSKEEIMEIALDRAREMSVGDSEQDKQCAYNYAVGMEEMQYRLLNEA